MDLASTLSAAEVRDFLGLEPYAEGGFFRETFRAAGVVDTPRGPRSLATGILFLLTQGSRSRFHRLRGDELWAHQAGAPVDLVMLSGGVRAAVTLATPDVPPGCGPRPGAGCEPQAIVPAGVWQAARVALRPGAPDWGLVACVVSPGFDYADFELAERDALLRDFMDDAEIIRELT